MSGPSKSRSEKINKLVAKLRFVDKSIIIKPGERYRSEYKQKISNLLRPNEVLKARMKKKANGELAITIVIDW